MRDGCPYEVRPLGNYWHPWGRVHGTVAQDFPPQKAAAAKLAIDQPRVSHLLRGQLAGFSTDRLMGFLTALGRDIGIVVKIPPRSRRRGRMRVVAA